MVAMRSERPRELSEDELDMVIEDSFPASDPPSHTPISGVGAMTEEEPGSRLSKKLIGLVFAGTVVLGAIATVAMKMMKGKSAKAAELEAA